MWFLGSDFRYLASPEGNSPIYCASVLGLTNVVKFLHSKGHDPGSKGDRFGFPLQGAIWSHHYDVAEYLIQSGADVNQKGGFLSTALHAAVDVAPIGIVRLLVEKGASVLLLNDAGQNPLHYACIRRKSDIALFLFNALDDSNRMSVISSIDKYGCTALTGAAWGGLQKLVELLLDRRADVNAEVEALWAAASEGHGKIVEMLLQRGGADTADGRQEALFAAARRGHQDVVKMLL
ncbi:ankyrin repeat-containing domain protein, partial [Phyllosticta capitalensis]